MGRLVALVALVLVGCASVSAGDASGRSDIRRERDAEADASADPAPSGPAPGADAGTAADDASDAAEAADGADGAGDAAEAADGADGAGDADGAAAGDAGASAAPAPGSFPGQSGNPVGYRAHGPLGTTPWPGGDFTSGTAASPTVYQGYVFSGPVVVSGKYIRFESCDFDSGAGGVDITGDNITFIGNRFQSNSVSNYNTQIDGGTNITFLYNSFTPRASLYMDPPGAAWPSAGAGQNTIDQVANVNAIDGNSGYQTAISVLSGGPLLADHNDFWGFGNSASQMLNTTAQLTYTNNWIHDAANAAPQSYHIDGIGYVNGMDGPSNILIQGNTIASLGNTNGLAFQAATSGYANIQIIGNYLSGFGYTIDLGSIGPAFFTNSSFKNNVFGTDITWIFGPVGDQTADFKGTTNTWSGNTFVVAPGTVAGPNAFTGGSYYPWTPSNQGNYLWPDASLHTTDWAP